MFKLNEKYEINWNISICDYIRYSPSKISTIKTPISQIYVNIPREDSVMSLLNSYLELSFGVLHAATGNRLVDIFDIRLAFLGPIAFLVVSGKHSKGINHAELASLVYKLITSARGTDDLSIGFDCNRDRKQRELTNHKTQKRKIHPRVYLKYMFGFAEHQEAATFGLGFKLTLTRNTDNAVWNLDNAINNAKIKIKAIEWYKSHYIPSFSKQAISSKQSLIRSPTELRKVEKSVFVKTVNIQNLWVFELGIQKGRNVPIWIIIPFQRRKRPDSQNFNIDTFYRPRVTSAICITGTTKNADSALLLNYDDDDHSQGYDQFK